MKRVAFSAACRHARQAVAVAHVATAALSVSLLLAAPQARSAPVTMTCTLAAVDGIANGTDGTDAGRTGKRSGKKQWVYDLQAQTVDGHHVGDPIAIKDGAYNRYFITDKAIGFTSSSGVRHTVSRADGSYTLFDANGKPNGSGQCAAAN